MQRIGAPRLGRRRCVQAMAGLLLGLRLKRRCLLRMLLTEDGVIPADAQGLLLRLLGWLWRGLLEPLRRGMCMLIRAGIV